MNATCTALAELAGARTAWLDALEDHTTAERVNACAVQYAEAAYACTGDIAWYPRRWTDDINLHVTLHGRDRRVRHREVCRSMERLLAKQDPNIDLRSGTVGRSICDAHATQTLELEDTIFATLARTHLDTEWIPYTDGGIGAVRDAIRGTLEAHGMTAVNISMPVHGEMTVEYRAANIVHNVEISGTVSID